MGQPPTPVENRDFETLNSIVSEVLFEKGTDTYRLPMPTDAEGKNLFHSAIERLEAWRQRNPGSSEDIVYYTEGLCYEKLGQPMNALETYRLVKTTDADLQKTVEEKISGLEDILNYFPPDQMGVGGLPPRDQSEEAIEAYKGTEWEPLVWILAENEAVNRALEERDSTGQVASTAYKEALEALIVRFSDSARIYEHWMRLGLYYENVAREWITVGEYGNNPKAWELADKALQKASEIYLKVSQADGFPEKREAQARLVTLEELSRKVERNLVR
ncbi:MAG: hypothetical protein H6751_15715 [Candidatus Omnitrophica bacterium]|nr:hypothetical protein [Candidatus Omnitrophota bacterium]MCA9426178.1 hypothetical protein [Candidatus Omnitrophota bacterium]MCB9767260.1 hypothetical protein [Candidatus Omnitrophota bacterium]MCB9784410.1 hypothetical protein [Candidatus Omnitrophota bacterium]